jgi:hypothetical protein
MPCVLLRPWGREPCCRSFKHNGYQHSAGSPAARSAVARRFSLEGHPPLTEEVRARLCWAVVGGSQFRLHPPLTPPPFRLLADHLTCLDVCVCVCVWNCNIDRTW